MIAYGGLQVFGLIGLFVGPASWRRCSQSGGNGWCMSTMPSGPYGERRRDLPVPSEEPNFHFAFRSKNCARAMSNDIPLRELTVRQVREQNGGPGPRRQQD